MSEENWMPVVGHEGYYSVSDLGRVRRDAAASGTQIGRILRNHNVRGYSSVTLSRHSVTQDTYVHSLVMAAFAGPRPGGLAINHKNGIKTDNRIENLEYVLPSANSMHAFDHDLSPHGARHHAAKLTEADIPRIRQALAKGQTLTAIARQYGVSPSAIWRIRYGKSWRRVA